MSIVTLSLGVLMWFYMLRGIVWMLNRFVSKAPFFNFGYLFLCVAGVFTALTVLGFHRDTEMMILGLLAWVIGAVVAYRMGRKFVELHRFSFPSVIWQKKTA